MSYCRDKGEVAKKSSQPKLFAFLFSMGILGWPSLLWTLELRTAMAQTHHHFAIMPADAYMNRPYY
jgi:hypothetical protein